MNFLRLLLRPWYRLASRVFALWARPVVHPDEPAELLTDSSLPVCYVLETGGLADTLALERICRLNDMPSPIHVLTFGEHREARRIVVMRRMRGFFMQRKGSTGSMRLKRLVKASIDAGGEELLLVPVAIYWGRSPDKEHSFFKLLFSENWEIAGRTRKFFATLLHGRNTLLRFSHPLPLKSIIQEGLDSEVAFRKVSRILRVHFRQRRTATVGPDLSQRGNLVNQVLSDPRVVRAIDGEAGDNRALIERTRHKARKYALEIAANRSYPTIRVLERVLRRVWNQIYDGVVLNHIDRLHDIAREHEVIYVPCHRSHIDYLLLGYIVYHQGLNVPYIAAGINLNMPVIGPILRRGGAFFLRRSFRGNKLYTAVFNAYLHQILTRGYPVKYFVEGGRSRTGRLLTPKGGMLAMTVNSYIHDARRKIAFVPFYFGYEKLIEGGAFISELGGAAKEKETFVGLLRSVKSLRENFGKVYVNTGKPILLDPILDEKQPDWRDFPKDREDRPPAFNKIIDELGSQIMSGINSAAAVTPISLLATALLSTPKQAMGALELNRQLRLSIDLLSRFRYSESVTLPEMTPEEIVDHGERMKFIRRTSHPLGDVINVAEPEAVLLTYFRNNVQHLFAVPASVACCFIQGRRLEHRELQRLVRMIYPFMQKELCLKWDYDDIDDVTSAAIEALIGLGILSKDGGILVRPPAGSERAFQLLLLGRSMVPMLQRFYLVISLLVKNGSGTLSRAKLETLCQKSAQRLAMVYELHSPDFFEKALFQDFIKTLRDLKVLRRNDAGFLEFDDNVMRIGEDARLVLGEEIRHSILSLTFSGPGVDRL